MGLSKIDICNHALLKVGSETIASLDVSTSTDEGVIYSAKLCNILFDQALVETLRLYPWNSVTKRASLTKLSDAPAFKYQYQYPLPNDFVRLINVYDSTDAYDDRREWVIEGENILCDYSSLYIKYIHKPQNVSVLDALASQALICKLAMKLAVPLQLDDKLQQTIMSELVTVVLPQARSIDTIENKSQDLEASEWIYSTNYTSPI